jgi:hypothetical protein
MDFLRDSVPSASPKEETHRVLAELVSREPDFVPYRTRASLTGRVQNVFVLSIGSDKYCARGIFDRQILAWMSYELCPASVAAHCYAERDPIAARVARNVQFNKQLSAVLDIREGIDASRPSAAQSIVVFETRGQWWGVLERS